MASESKEEDHQGDGGIEREQPSAFLNSVAKTNASIASNLHKGIQSHVRGGDGGSEYDARKDGLDFLEVKNTLMLSYLIDLTTLMRCRLRQSKNPSDNSGVAAPDDDGGSDEGDPSGTSLTAEGCIERLTEMKSALDKIRPMEKRLRYQMDKLLALSTSAAGTFAGGDGVSASERRRETNTSGPSDGKDAGNPEEAEDDADESFKKSDPLSFRPDLEGMLEDDGEQIAQDGGSSGAESGDDEEYRTTKANISIEKEDKETDPSSNIYRAPRLQAVPFEGDAEQKRMDKEDRLLKKQRNRMRHSELAEVVRAQYGDAPEEEDMRGGAQLGRQREATRRATEREAEKEKFEEDAMIRLTTTRVEKKERKRMMREELSNLSSIADVGNLAAGVDVAFGNGRRHEKEGSSGGRYSTGEDDGAQTKGMRKRRVEVLDHEVSQGKMGGGRRSKGASNSFQKALYGTKGTTKRSKKK